MHFFCQGFLYQGGNFLVTAKKREHQNQNSNQHKAGVVAACGDASHRAVVTAAVSALHAAHHAAVATVTAAAVAAVAAVAGAILYAADHAAVVLTAAVILTAARADASHYTVVHAVVIAVAVTVTVVIGGAPHHAVAVASIVCHVKSHPLLYCGLAAGFSICRLGLVVHNLPFRCIKWNILLGDLV